MSRAYRIGLIANVVAAVVCSAATLVLMEIHNVVGFIVASVFAVATAVGVSELFERAPFIWKHLALAQSVESMSRKVNVPRRPYERLSDWRHRVLEAHHELCEAEREFVEAAERDGSMVRVGPVEQWMLPPTHPASIRLAKARNEPVMSVNTAYRGAVH